MYVRHQIDEGTVSVYILCSLALVFNGDRTVAGRFSFLISLLGAGLTGTAFIGD